MVSEKLFQILRSKSGLSDEEIANLSEAEGWKLVYAVPKKEKEQRKQICFTGFSASERDGLVSRATSSGWLIVKDSVTKDLSFLCCGDTPGASKLKKAREQGVILLDREQFSRLLLDGELPSSSP